jgi:hypothetical protein
VEIERMLAEGTDALERVADLRYRLRARRSAVICQP